MSNIVSKQTGIGILFIPQVRRHCSFAHYAVAYTYFIITVPQLGPFRSSFDLAIESTCPNLLLELLISGSELFSQMRQVLLLNTPTAVRTTFSTTCPVGVKRKNQAAPQPAAKIQGRPRPSSEPSRSRKPRILLRRPFLTSSLLSWATTCQPISL